MKKRNMIRPGGILRWSTAFILAGGVAGLSSCDKGVRNVMDEKASSKDSSATAVPEIDPVQKQLESGLVENNFHLPKVGYYHAVPCTFYEFPYNQYKDDQWFVNGQWQSAPGPDGIPASRPTPEELKKVETALEQEEAVRQPQSGTASNYSSGPGIGTALMMYWMLSGNRGYYSPGPGFHRAGSLAPSWQQRRQEERFRSGGSGGNATSSGRSGAYNPSRGNSSLDTGSSTSSSRGGFGSSGSSSFRGSGS